MAVAQHQSGFKSAVTLRAAQLLVAFLNTRPHADAGDGLADSDPNEEILNGFTTGLQHGELSDRNALRSLRDALVLTLSEDEPEADRAWSEVTQLTSSVTVRRVFTTDGVRLEPAGGEAVLGSVAAAIQAVVEADSWSRLRICPNHLCDLVFYDTTRSRTQKWDSYETCGNRANVSAHRARVQERRAS